MTKASKFEVSVQDASLPMTPPETVVQQQIHWVVRKIRDDPLGFMHADHTISDAQFQAGRMWQAKAEKDLASIGHAGAALGKVGAEVVHDILYEGHSVADVAGKFGDQRRSKTLAGWHIFFVRCLDILAVEFGVSAAEAAAFS